MVAITRFEELLYLAMRLVVGRRDEIMVIISRMIAENEKKELPRLDNANNIGLQSHGDRMAG